MVPHTIFFLKYKDLVSGFCSINQWLLFCDAIFKGDSVRAFSGRSEVLFKLLKYNFVGSILKSVAMKTVPFLSHLSKTAS